MADDQDATTPGKPDEISEEDLNQVSGGTGGTVNTAYKEKVEGWIEITGNMTGLGE